MTGIAQIGRRTVLALATALLLAACGSASDPTPDYRYRLTVEVDTPEGLRTGSGVIEVDTHEASRRASFPGQLRHRVRGEAVAVDLPDGQTLYALLRSESDIDWASRVMFLLASPNGSAGKSSFQRQFDNMLRLRGEQVLPRIWSRRIYPKPRSAYPMLVTFADESDPTSVELVNPDDLAVTFGEGIKLEQITVSLTDDPITMAIEDRLDWLPKTYDRMLDGRRLNTIEAENQRANMLSQGSFFKGIIQ